MEETRKRKRKRKEERVGDGFLNGVDGRMSWPRKKKKAFGCETPLPDWETPPQSLPDEA